MTCAHEIFSRYVGTESGPDGEELIRVGCKTCAATVLFPAKAGRALKYEAMKADYAAGMTCAEIAAKHGYKNRGTVINLLAGMGVKMRRRGWRSGKHKHTPETKAKLRVARLRTLGKKIPPDFDPNEKIEDLGAHFALCNELRIAKP